MQLPLCLLPLALLAACAAPHATSGASSPVSAAAATGVQQPVVELPSKGLSTLYLRDPESHAISFDNGSPGGVLIGDTVYNHSSDMDFGHYNPDSFTVGIEGGRDGVIVDLGTPDQLEERYGYAETVGGGQGFASIQRTADGLWIRSGEDASPQLLTEAEALFDGRIAAQDRQWVSANDHARALEDHIYALRLWDRHEPGFSRVVKFHVVALVPGTSATIRWVRLEG